MFRPLSSTACGTCPGVLPPLPGHEIMCTKGLGLAGEAYQAGPRPPAGSGTTPGNPETSPTKQVFRRSSTGGRDSTPVTPLFGLGKG